MPQQPKLSSFVIVLDNELYLDNNHKKDGLEYK